MSGYTVQLNTGIATSQYTIHTWIQINKPDGASEAYGFYPKYDTAGNMIYGPGDVRAEPPDASPTSTSGPIHITEAQYQSLSEYIRLGDITPPNYSIPIGSQCANWALMALAHSGIIPNVLGPDSGSAAWVQTWIWNPVWQQVAWFYRDLYIRAKNWLQPRDPIILDLDGNGLDTIGLGGNVHFDHDGDGALTRTGWVGGNDALLVWDRDANGSIDSGAELFGDFTPLPNGTLAPNGFAALAALDDNADGVLDASDSAFASLRLWIDPDQNGATGQGELISLAEAGIASLDLANTPRNRNLTNGNQLSREGSFTRTDGTSSAMGEFRLAIDTFDTRFAETIDVPEALKNLPNMNGSGSVRELRQAATLSGSLVDVLDRFQAATTRGEQKALLDEVLGAWADTSGMGGSLEERVQGRYRIEYEAFGNVRRSSSLDAAAWAATASGGVAGSSALLSDAGAAYLSEDYRNLIGAWSRKLHVLEAFSGQYFFNLPDARSQSPGANWGVSLVAGSTRAGATAIERLPLLRLNFSQPQLDLLQQAYDSLKESAYSSLVMQTRLRPYLDQIEIGIDANGIRLDATQLDGMLAERRLADPEGYLGDLLDLDRYASSFLSGSNWSGLAGFDAFVDSLPDAPAIGSLLDEFNVRRLSAGNDNLSLADRADIVLAGGGNDVLYGNNGNDRLFGEDGNDRLYGGNGDDLLSGGAGADLLYGQAGADLYMFGRGDGDDTVLDNAEKGIRRDTVRFVGLVPADIRVQADHVDNLIFTVMDTGDTLAVPGTGYSWGDNGVGRYVFDDGTVWSHDEALRATMVAATDGDDLIHGTSSADFIVGQAGNDTLIGNAGDDVIDGSAGDDLLIGATGWDSIHRDGQWRLERNAMPQVLANGNDTYLFGRGDGRDTVIDGDYTSGNMDTLRFKEGVAPGDVRLVRSGNDLLLKIRNSDDQVRLDRYFHEIWAGVNGPYLIERIAFADGTAWSFDDVQALLFAGSEEAETIVGSHKSDRLAGGGGDDVLLGGAGRDVLDGGAGNDELHGGGIALGDGRFYDGDGAGDTYRFGRGDGHDAIIEDSWTPGEIDRIELEAGVSPADVRLERVRITAGWPVRDDLGLTIRDTGETLTVRDHFNESDRHAVEEIVFADGTHWDMEAMRSRILLGEAGDDVLRGFNERDDLIIGAAGNDHLLGLGGDDVLEGGPGDDVLEGGPGSDTYRFAPGDGLDTIIEGHTSGEDVVELGAGITSADLTVRWTMQGGMSVLAPDGGGFVVRGQAEPWSDLYGIEELRFADGTVWGRDELAARALEATPGDDVIVGSHYDDILAGGTGNDRFRNPGGYDTYRFGSGDGQDVIEATRGRVSFGPGITQNDVGFGRDGNDLIATIAGGGDSLRLEGWLTERWQRIDRFEFANGARLVVNDVLAKLDVREGSEVLYGSPGDDVLTGTEKNSTIYGRDGNDVLIGSAGSDTLYGEAGDDTLDGGADRDWLYGGAGENRYIMAPGMGLDEAFGEQLALASDTVVFAPGIRPDGVSVQLGETSGWWGAQAGDIGYQSLVIGIGGNDALAVRTRNRDDLARGAIQRFRFDDGTGWTLSDLIAHADGGTLGWQQRYENEPTTILGSHGDDEIHDYSGQSVTVLARGNDDAVYLGGGDNLVFGGSGDDSIYTGWGDDLIAGETGVDELDTGAGDDTIAVNHGDGHDRLLAGDGVDTLSFGGNTTPDKLSARLDRDGHVVLQLDGGAGGTIILGGTSAETPSGDLERIQFIDADGGVRIFDLTAWLDARGPDLLSATTASPLVFDAADFELTGKVAPAGGLEAVAYAQSGDPFAAPRLVHNLPTGGDDLLYGTAEADVLDAGAGNDIILGLAGDDFISGGDGDDLILGGDGDDVLEGGAGDDTIRGGRGADTLSGGTGRDALHGEWGGDSYLYQTGDGPTIIDDEHRVFALYEPTAEAGRAAFSDGDEWSEEGGEWEDEPRIDFDDAPNILSFGSGIRPQDLRFSEQDGDLLVEFANQPQDRLILRGFDPGRATQTRSIDIIRFADGTEIVAGAIEPAGLTLSAGDEGASLEGTPYADTLIGGAGDDWLEGNGGADRLSGGTGSDTYAIHKAWGSAPVVTTIGETWRAQDFNRIELSGEIMGSDLALGFDGRELLLQLSNEGDAIRFPGFDPRLAGMRAPFDELDLHWGSSSLSFDELLERGVRIVGTPGDDVLEGTSFADWFEGRESDDTMSGAGGGDLYFIEAGGGVDTIIDSEDGDAPNVLVLPEGTDIDDLCLSYDDEGFLIIDIAATDNRIRLSGFDPGNPQGARAVEYFRFGLDGEEIGYEELLSRGFDIVGTQENDVLTGTSLADRVWGGEGNDLLEATPGGDWLMGQGGNDTYAVSVGDGIVNIDDIAMEGAGNVLRFGPGIDPDALRNNLRFEADGSGGNVLLIAYGEDDDSVRLSGFDPSDVPGAHAIERFEFADGTAADYTTLVSWTFVVEGDGADNLLAGTSVGDRLYGHDGDDVLEAGAGEDVLTGGRGNDLLRGGAGRDAYVFVPGDGEDLIDDGVDAGVGNVLAFGEGVAREDLRIEARDADLLIRYGSADDGVRVGNFAPYGASGGTVIDTVEFADGTAVTLRELMNHAPTLASPVADQVATTGVGFSLVLPPDLFVDADGDEVLSRISVSGDANRLQWLHYDAPTRTLHGTPGNDDLGQFDIIVQGVDAFGASAFHGFGLEVQQAEDEPAAGIAAPDTAGVIEDRKLLARGNVLDNDRAPQGSALRVLDPGIRRGEYGVLALLPSGFYAYVLDDLSPKVQGLGAGETVTDRFGYLAGNGTIRGGSELEVTVQGSNDAPRLARALADVQLARGKTFSWQLPAGSFRDVDRNDTLSYTATLANGKPLPAWLGFDAPTQTFSGTAPGALPGGLKLRITASDGHGAGSSASDVFRIDVGDRTVAPSARESVGSLAESTSGGGDFSANPGVPSDQPKPAQRSDGLLDRFLDAFNLHDAPGSFVLPAANRDWFAPPQHPLQEDSFVATAQGGQDFERCWAELGQALHRLDVERRNAPTWTQPGQGADLSGLSGGLFGGTRGAGGGVDAVTLVAESQQLKAFAGLREGIGALVRW